jgi:hypothetical protein
MQAVGDEGHKDVRFNAPLELVKDGTELEIVLQILERRLDLRELDIELPELCRISST